MENLQDAALDRLSNFVGGYTANRLDELDRSIRQLGKHRWAAVHDGASWKWWVDVPNLLGPATPMLQMAELWLLSCHANGYVRERAVSLLAGARDEISVRFLAMKSMDWVEQVANRAADAGKKLLFENPDRLIEVLPLLPRLDRSARPQARGLGAQISELLRASPQRDLLVRSLQSADRDVSRPASLIADELGDVALQSVAEAAALSRDAVVRTRVVRWERRLRVTAPDLAAKFRSQFLNDPSATLRAEALQAHIAVGGDQEAIVAALSDVSAAIRNIARYHLRDTITREQIAERYRSMIACESSVSEHAAVISGLGEVGEQTDAVFLRQFLTHTPRIARSTMQAIARLDPNGSRDLFIEMLGDGRIGVQRQALRLIERRLTADDEPVLRRHTISEDAPDRRPIALAMLRLPVWESLSCLLDLGAIDIEVARNALKRWKAESRPGYAPPRLDRAEGGRLEAGLFAIAKALDRRIADYIAREISFWTQD